MNGKPVTSSDARTTLSWIFLDRKTDTIQKIPFQESLGWKKMNQCWFCLYLDTVKGPYCAIMACKHNVCVSAALMGVRRLFGSQH